MKTLCFLIPLLLYITKFICSHHLNVGTVLFTKSHLHKKCWSDREIVLLSARQVMQGVLPDPDLIDFSKPRTINVLLDYFQSCFEVISLSPCRKTHRIMFLALADALGGYFRSYILPLTRQAYYAGHIKYFQAKKAYRFYEELKEFLKTNGAGWAEPRTCTLKSKIKPLKIPTKNYEDACSQLYLRDDSRSRAKWHPYKNDDATTTGSPMSANNQCEFHDEKRLTDIMERLRDWENVKPKGDTLNRIAEAANFNEGNEENIEKIRKKMKLNKRRLRSYMTNSTIFSGENDPRLNFDNSSIEALLQEKSLRKRSDYCLDKVHNEKECHKMPLMVPLPVLDDQTEPKAIALPFKVRPLRSLCSPHAISILVRYYITVVRCLLSKTKNKCHFYNFNSQFQCWLVTNIFPHLNREEWYPAFGAVLRIDATINTFSSNSFAKCKSTCQSDIRYLFSKEHAADEYDYLKEEEYPSMVVTPCRTKDGKFLIIGILIIIVVWIIALCYCICCHCSNPKEECEEEVPRNTSYDKKQKKKKVDMSNSFIVQCLVKFFKRAEEERKDNESLNQNMVYDTYYGNMEPRKEVELDRGESCTRSVRNECPAMRSVSREKLQRETIVLPAMEYNTFWPFADFLDDKNINKHYPKGMRCLFNKKEPLQTRNMKSFRTLWKREQSAVRTSDSCEGTHNQNTTRRPQKCILKRKADVLSRSSYSDSEDSGDSNKRMIMSRSHTYYKYPGSCCYSCNSSSGHFSPTQAEFLSRAKNCREYFVKKARMESKKRKSESETETNLTSCSSSEESFSPVKRMP